MNSQHSSFVKFYGKENVASAVVVVLLKKILLSLSLSLVSPIVCWLSKVTSRICLSLLLPLSQFFPLLIYLLNERDILLFIGGGGAVFI